MVHAYRAVRDELNPVTKKHGGGGLTLLHIKEEDPSTADIISRVLLYDDDIVDAVHDFHTNHYGQENSTVVGGGDYYKPLTDKPMTNPVYEEIINGTFASRPDLIAVHKL